MRDELAALDLSEQRIAAYAAQIAAQAREHPPVQRLQGIAGIGPLTAAAVVATVGQPQEFRNGRQFAAWPPWCRHRASTATATSACSRPTHPGGLRSPPSCRSPRRQRTHPPRIPNPPPNRPIVVPPATPGRCCPPASMNCSRSGAPTVVAKCTSSPSSPTPPRCAPSSSTSAGRQHHPGSRRPRPAAAGAGRCWAGFVIRSGAPDRPGLRVRSAPQLVARQSSAPCALVAGGSHAHRRQPSPLSSLSGCRPLERPLRQHHRHGAPRHRRSTRPTQPPMGGVV